MTDIDEALKAVGYLEAEATVAPEVSSNNVVRLLPIIRQALEQQRVPEGWKLVPDVMTQEMQEAVVNAALARGRSDQQLDWQVALAAVPEPENDG